MIISRTPFRVSFFGGGTDFPEFYARHGGAVLLTTINKYCYISIHTLSAFFAHRYRASYARTETVQQPSEFQHPLIRECLLHLPPSEGLEIAHVSDLPGRTGLGTSSSFTVGLLHTLHAMEGRRVTAEDLAREAILIERERVGDAGGHQDQYAAAYGGLIRLDFQGPNSVAIQRLPLHIERLHALESRLMLFFTGIEQSAEQILSEQKKRTAQNEDALLSLRGMVDRATEILCGDGALEDFGSLLHQSWQHKKTLSPGISNPLVDAAYDASRGAGALGGKLLGAGGRGFLLLFAPPEAQRSIRTALPELREVPFRFSMEGSRIIFTSQE